VILNLLFVKGYCLLYAPINCFGEQYLIFYAYLNLTWFILAMAFGAQRIGRNTQKKSILFTTVKIIVFFFFMFLLYFQIISLNYYSRDDLKFLFPIFFLVLIMWKFGLYYSFLFYRKLGYNFRNVVVLGYTPLTRDLRQYFVDNRWNGYRFLGFFDHQKNEKKEIVGKWNDLNEFLEQNDVDEIYLAWNKIPHDELPHINTVLSNYPLKIRIVPDLGEFSYKSTELVNYDMIPVLQVHPGPLSYVFNRAVKRIFDVFFSIIMIVCFLSWISIILYLLSLFGSREGVFFKQKRTGADGRVFICHKFRTMKRNRDADEKQATKNDKRITPVGRFLRKFSLDELPQFINVLLGQMSVVGPRPHMLRHTSQYKKMVRKFMLRHTVKPGITGLAQVRGYRGEIRKVSEIKDRVGMDVNYIENWSFWLDLKIIFLTITNIFKGEKRAY